MKYGWELLPLENARVISPDKQSVFVPTWPGEDQTVMWSYEVPSGVSSYYDITIISAALPVEAYQSTELLISFSFLDPPFFYLNITYSALQKFSNNMKIFSYISENIWSQMMFSNNMDRDQAPRNVEPDLQSIWFETQHHVLLKTGCNSWDDLNSENKEIMPS